MSTLDVVCCSLEPWDEVWRRNQFLATGMVEQREDLRLLFVELPFDATWTLLHGRLHRPPGLRSIGRSGRLWAVTPTKWLPRRIWPGADRSLQRKLLRLLGRLGFTRPVLWINDCSYAGLLDLRDWPCVYDITDDWLLIDGSERELERLRRNDADLLERADEVVVCSPALAASRGAARSVHLIPNGVDVAHLRTPMPRPADLPDGPVVLYQGSAAATRLDVELCVEIATRISGRATLVLLGPSSLDRATEAILRRAGVVLLGSRPYRTVPAYMQAARVLVVPHLVNPFTESLDPIKARELVALGRPTLSTPVAGLRDIGPPIHVAERHNFASRLEELLDEETPPEGPGPLLGRPPSWEERSSEFLRVIEAASGGEGRCSR
jgi:teichuronic acid biosynthesis glycosyltransferase TuaH